MDKHMIHPLGILVLLMSGCGVARPLGVEEFKGTWVATSSSLSKLPEAPHNCVMELRADGSCLVENLPDLAYQTPDHAKGVFASGTGKWWVSAIAGEQVLRCELRKLPDSITGDTIIEVRIRQVRSGLRLFFFIGDPDEGNLFEFEKKQ
jgi:hypothetical protein